MNIKIFIIEKNYGILKLMKRKVNNNNLNCNI